MSLHTYNAILFSLKVERILTHAITQMNLEDMMLSELSQLQKKYHWFHLYEVLVVIKFTDTKRRVVTRVSEGEE